MPFGLAACCFLKRETPEEKSGRGNTKRRRFLCKEVSTVLDLPSVEEGLCFSSLGGTENHWEEGFGKQRHVRLKEQLEPF